MKYLYNRNGFLSTINDIKVETKEEFRINESSLTNNITFGGSLLGRFINSAIRKLKIGYNLTKIDGVVKSIEKELENIAVAFSDEKNAANDLLVKEILREIYNIVAGERTDEEKIKFLLDKENGENGLISGCIDFINKLPDDTSFEVGNKQDLIDKLEKFKEELEKMKIPKQEEQIEDNFDDSVLSFLKELLIFGNEIQNEPKKQEESKFEKGKIYKYTSKDNKIGFVKILDIDTNGLKLQYITYPKTIFTIDPKNVKLEPVINIDYTDPKTKKVLIVKNGLLQENFLQLRYFNFIKESNLPVHIQTDKTYENLLRVFNLNLKSNLNEIRTLVNNQNSDELKKLGYSIIENFNEIKGFSVTESLNIDKISKDIASMLQIFYSLKDKKYLNIDNIINLYESMLKEYNISSLKKESLIFEEIATLPPSPEEENRAKEEVESIEENETEESEEKNVKTIWKKYFSEGEENKWKVEIKKANEIAEKVENSVETPANTNKMKEEMKQNKDARESIISIANLFGQAYRLYKHNTIPSNRPNGKISMQTYSEYKYIGSSRESAPVPSENAGPEYGPWVNIKIYDKFTDQISALLENPKYQKLLSGGQMKTTLGKKIVTGNPLGQFIRDMINENTLKSYEKNRATLISKYFGLDMKDIETKYSDDKKDLENETKTSDKLFWQETKSLSYNQLDKGNFFAITYTSSKEVEDNSGKKIIKTKHPTLVCEVIEKQENNILVKYTKLNESLIWAYYGGSQLEKSYFNEPIKANCDVFMGLIKMEKPISDGNKFKFKSIKKATNQKNLSDQIEEEIIMPTIIGADKGIGRKTQLRAPLAKLMKGSEFGDESVIGKTLSDPTRLKKDFEGISYETYYNLLAGK